MLFRTRIFSIVKNIIGDKKKEFLDKNATILETSALVLYLVHAVLLNVMTQFR